jgi:hypothetical protein
MMKITRCITHKGRWELEFSVIDSEDCFWLILYEINKSHSFKAWSLKKTAADKLPNEDALVQRIIELAELSENMANLLENLMKTMDCNNWEYWGSGMPDPLSNFYGSGEFNRQCKFFENDYSYVGPPEIRDSISLDTPGKPILSESDVLIWIEETDQILDESNSVTSTYVINKSGTLLIADRHSEHVACAGGEPVLSAGEITFEIIDQKVEIVYVSNQSTGYCPEPSSWKAVREALYEANIKPPSSFTAEFEFRKCTSCDTINIIKDEHFYCSVCDSQLPKTWNF